MPGCNTADGFLSQLLFCLLLQAGTRGTVGTPVMHPADPASENGHVPAMMMACARV